MNCEVCGNELNIPDGGCAVMMAFCRGHNTNLINVAFCEDCYKALVEPHFRAFAIGTGQTICGLTDEEENGRK